MKQYWQKLVLRINALTLRERAIVFAAAVLVLVVLLNTMLLNPQYLKQTHLSQQIKQQQSQVADLQNQIQQRVKSQELDPDQMARDRLVSLRQQAQKMGDSLTDLQKSLVPPTKMADLLEDVLRRNDKLTLVSLKTLPVTTLNDPVPGVKTAGATSPSAVADGNEQSNQIQTVFKHTVELTVQGSYMDMLAYMRSLEKMPWQLFWSNAQLNVDEYPKATLTLTVFTLSLDKRWLNL